MACLKYFEMPKSVIALKYLHLALFKRSINFKNSTKNKIKNYFKLYLLG